jgi:hypothetical protein
MKELLIIGTAFIAVVVINIVALLAIANNEEKSSIKWGYDATNKRWYKVERSSTADKKC